MYQVISEMTEEEALAKLNKLAKEGWRLICVRANAEAVIYYIKK